MEYNCSKILAKNAHNYTREAFLSDGWKIRKINLIYQRKMTHASPIPSQIPKQTNALGNLSHCVHFFDQSTAECNYGCALEVCSNLFTWFTVKFQTDKNSCNKGVHWTKSRLSREKYMHRLGVDPGPPACPARILPRNHRCYVIILLFWEKMSCFLNKKIQKKYKYYMGNWLHVYICL